MQKFFEWFNRKEYCIFKINLSSGIPDDHI